MGTPNLDQQKDAIANEIKIELNLTPEQEAKMKVAMKERAQSITTDKLKTLKSELLSRVRAEKHDDGKLEDQEIEGAVEEAVQATNTTTATPSPGSTRAENSPSVLEAPETTPPPSEPKRRESTIEKAIGRMIRELTYFIKGLFIGNDIPFKDMEKLKKDTFEILKSMSFAIPENRDNDDIGMQIAAGLQTHGIPLAKATNFLQYIDGDNTIEIPGDLQNIFEAGRTHYSKISIEQKQSDPIGAIEEMFNFTAKSTNTPAPSPPPVATPPATPPPATSEAPKDGEKLTFKQTNGNNIDLTVSNEVKKSFEDVKKTYETIILSATAKPQQKVDTLVETAFTKSKETDAAKKSLEALTNATREMVKIIRDQTKVVNSDGKALEEIGGDTNKINLSDGSLASLTMEEMQEKLKQYLPLAFTEMRKYAEKEIIWKVKIMNQSKQEYNEDDYQKVADTMIQSLPQKNPTPETVVDAYARIVKQIWVLQTLNLNSHDEIKKYIEKSPLQDVG